MTEPTGSANAGETVSLTSSEPDAPPYAVTVRPPASAPPSVHVAAALVAVPVTLSEKETVIRAGSRETAESMTGAMPSETCTDAARISLPAASLASPADGTYVRVTRSRFRITRLPSSVNTRVSDPDEMSEREFTWKPAPYTRQPAAPDVPSAVTGSLNATVISSSAVARAVNVGAMPSETCTDASAARALDDLSSMVPKPDPSSVPTSVRDVS